MDVKLAFDEAIAPKRLLEHPFYQSWNEGTLPVEALRTYAAEYGAFIAKVAEGWETVGWDEHAEEERYHAELWEDFAKSVGTKLNEPRIPEVKALIDTCNSLFSDPDQAWGALYAFEAQQPETAATKLIGLETHYDVELEGKVYFEVHANDLYEADIILEHLESTDDASREKALAACGEMSEALWDALTGVHESYASN